MSKQNETTGKKAVGLYWMVAILSLFLLIQNIGQASDLDQQLMEAAKKGDNKQLEELIDSGSDVNSTDIAGITPLICAAKFGHIQCVRTLLEKGAFINSKCAIKKCSPLMWAADNGHTEIVKVLINNGATLNAKDFYGWTALMKAVYRGHVEIVQALVENRANVNVKNNGGITALYVAELKAQPEILRLLKEVGAKK